MGSIVLIAIRHDLVNDIPADINCLIDHEINLSDQIPKLYTSRPLSDIGTHHFRTTMLRDNGILISQYHDAEYKTELMISSDFMLDLVRFPAIVWDKVNSERDMIKQATRAIQKGRFPFRNSAKRAGYSLDLTDPTPASLGASPVSLFSFNTDNMSEANTRANITRLICFCLAGIADKSMFASNYISNDGRAYWGGFGRIDYIGTIPRNTSAIVKLYHGQASLLRVPYRHIDMQLHTNKTDGLEAFVDIKEQASLSVLKSFGISLKKQQDEITPSM